MQGFQPLEPEDEVFFLFEQLVRSEDSSVLDLKLPPSEKPDRQFLALQLSNSLDKLKDLKEPLKEENAKTLALLIFHLKDELKMLKRDPTEYQLRLESLQADGPMLNPTKPLPSETGFEIKAARLEGEYQSKGKINYLKSILHIAYKGFQDIEAHFEVNARNQVAPENREDQAEAYFPRWNMRIENKAGMDEIKIGRYSSDVGLGLGINSAFEGLEASKQYKDYEMRFGYHRGFFGSVSTPAILDLPITLYMLQEKNEDKGTNWLSGVAFKQEIGNFVLGSEFVESSLNIDQTKKDRGAFSIHLGYQPESTWKISSSLTHTGEGYNAAQGWDPGSDWYFGVSENVQEKVSRSLTKFFGKRVSNLPGYSDFQMSFAYDLGSDRNLLLSWDWAYDHSQFNLYAKDQFQVASLELGWGIRKDSHFALRIEQLMWNDTQSYSTSPLGNFFKEDSISIESGISMKF